MKSFVNTIILIGMFITMLTVAGCGPEKPPAKAKLVKLEDFFKNPDKSGFQLSPDGKFYSFTAPWKKRMNIFVQEIGKKSSIQLTFETERDISGYFWGNNSRILYLKDAKGDENFKLYGVNTDGTNPMCLTDFPKVTTQIIDDLPEIDEYVIIGLNKRNPEIFDPYRLNINTGEMTMLAENPGNIQEWITDHDGKLRAATAVVDGVNTSLLFRETEKDPFKTVITTSFKESLSPFFFTFDNKNLYASSNIGRDKSVIVEFDPRTAKEVKVLYENKDYDVSSLNYSRLRKVLTTAIYTSWKTERYFFDQDMEKLFKKLRKELGEYEISISSMDKAEEKFIVRTYSDKSLGAYYLYNKTTENLSKITDLSPWLDEKNMGSQIPVEYQSQDGMTIHAYLTLPLGYTLKNAKKLPVIVNPHGGPWVRDRWGFNSEAQFLANRGYAVFQMNYRGSTGYGRKFWEASFKQWGLKMQDDITDGVNWLIEKGIADPERVAIYGGSYGGYATLSGIVKTPELYAAAIDYVGVSNLLTFMKTVPPYWKPFMEMMYEMVGNPQKDSVAMIASSPVFHVDKIKTPLFIAQGANDPRVNKAESDQMVEALKKRGIVVEYMVKDNEGHGFHNEENRFDFYRAMEKFLGTNLKGK